eukprot:gene1076-17730_t
MLGIRAPVPGVEAEYAVGAKLEVLRSTGHWSPCTVSA